VLDGSPGLTQMWWGRPASTPLSTKPCSFSTNQSTSGTCGRSTSGGGLLLSTTSSHGCIWSEEPAHSMAFIL
jgi:hypothetical protein